MKKVNDHHHHTQKISPSSPNTSSTSPPRKGSLMSSKVSPPVVDLARCNKHKYLWKSVVRAFARYLTCLKPMPRDGSKESEEAVSSNYSLQMSPNYYSEMNDEERNDKLKSAIVYCKQTTGTIDVQDKSQH